jgi:Protein of unknown function (DUF533)
MSLIGTLAKIAAGIAVAKGAQAVLRGRSGGTTAQAPGGGLGDILEQLGRSQAGTGSRQPGGAPSGGGGSVLDEILGQLTGGQGGHSGGPGRNPSRGELGEIFKDFTNDKRGSDSGLDDLFSDKADGTNPGNPGKTGGFGEIFNDSLQRGGEPKVQPTQQQEALAALMLRATIQAAKADGRLDEGERNRLTETLGDISKAELRFVENEMQRPVDAKGLASEVPQGLEPQVYAMSVMGIDLDERSEAQYLHELASAMGLSRDAVNAIHDQLRVPRIYA